MSSQTPIPPSSPRKTPRFNRGVRVEKKTTSWAPRSDERDRIDFIYASSDLRPANAWVVGPRTCFVGEQKVADPGEDRYLCADLPWPSDHKGVLVEFGF